MGFFSRMWEASCCTRQRPVDSGFGPVKGKLSDRAGAPSFGLIQGAEDGPAKNSAFVFIKPDALNDQVKALVEQKLKGAGISILEEGVTTGEEIEEKKLVDQHYYSIASKATLMKPDELNIPKDKFKEFASVDWEDALEMGWVFNALDACEYLEVTPDELEKLWGEAKKGATGWVKLAGGVQCARLVVAGKDPVFVFNGFFMSMRAKFVRPGPCIHWYIVEWDPKDLTWADFRCKLLGATNPAEAEEGSLRRQLMDEWQALGMASQPTIGENGIHASASPFEAFVERCNWRSHQLGEDPFGELLLDAGFPENTLQAWRRDPQVTIARNKTGSLFDQLEDLDCDACIKKCHELQKMQP